MSKQAIGTIDMIPPGEGRVFALGTHRIAVFRTHGGAVYATQTHCPHKAGPLADGLIDETSVVCPLHDRTFDFRTGAAVNNDCPAIRVYPVSLGADGTIMLEAAAAELETAGD